MNVMIEGGNITGYKVNVEITFVVEDAHERGPARESGVRAIALAGP